jgi:hypothetical protein
MAPGNLTFKTIQDMALEDAFPESKRADAKVWIQDTLTDLWDAENYIYKSTIIATTVVNGILTSPADLADVYAIYDPYGARLQSFNDVGQFYNHYNANLQPSGVAESYCVVGNAVAVEPHSSGTVSGFQLAYKKASPVLANDSDLTGLPPGYDMSLVYGAKDIGFTLINNPFADDFHQKYLAKKQALRDAYTYGIDEPGEQVAAFRPYYLSGY